VSLALLRFARWDPGERRELLPLRGAGESGRRLFTLAREWPELSAGSRCIGLYQAVGDERRLQQQALHDAVDEGSFDSLVPAEAIFQHLVYGPFTSLAIALDCRGPFRVFEAEGVGGGLAVQSAMDDLQRGRCDLALVGAYRLHDRSWLMLLGPEHGEGCLRRWAAGFGAPAEERVRARLTKFVEPLAPFESDLHAGATLAAAMRAAMLGGASAVAMACGDERMVLGFEGGEDVHG
jgi:hypothetical protein